MILLSFSFPFHFTSPPLIHPLYIPPTSHFSIPLHTTSPPSTANIQKPPMLLCYCVTVLLRYCVQESHVRSFSSSRIYVLGNMYIRLGQHVYTLLSEDERWGYGATD